MQHNWFDEKGRQGMFIRRDEPDILVLPWGGARPGGEQVLCREILRLAARVQEHDRLLIELARVLGIDLEALERDGLEIGPAVLGAAQELASGIRGKNARLAELADRVNALEADLETTEGLKSEAYGEREELAARVAELASLLEGHQVNARLTKKIIEALNRSADSKIASLIKERRRLETDLRTAIRTGEELAAKADWRGRALESLNEDIRELAAERDRLREENLQHYEMAMRERVKLRLRIGKLDALLASEEVPAGLTAAIAHELDTRGSFSVEADAAWRWFREQLGAQ